MFRENKIEEERRVKIREGCQTKKVGMGCTSYTEGRWGVKCQKESGNWWGGRWGQMEKVKLENIVYECILLVECRLLV